MRQTTLQLKPEDRHVLQEFRAKGLHRARAVNRAHMLLALDQEIPEATIMTVLGVGRTAIWRTRSAYGEQGLDYALHDAARTGAPRDYQIKQEAEVVALACSQPPAGTKRWTLKLLTQAARERPEMKQISRESIRRFLKKTSASPGAKSCGASAK
jgi:Homeodomain-like domain